jgi:hypothetical protein
MIAVAVSACPLNDAVENHPGIDATLLRRCTQTSISFTLFIPKRATSSGAAAADNRRVGDHRDRWRIDNHQIVAFIRPVQQLLDAYASEAPPD